MEFPPVTLNNRILNVEIINTRNRNAYARVKENSIVISIPSSLSKDSAYKVANGLYERIKRNVIKRPERYLSAEEILSFHDNQTINLFGRTFTFHISNLDLRRSSARINNNDIFIKLPISLEAGSSKKIIFNLTRRLLSKEILPIINERVENINRMYFKSRIKRVRLANATSRWGSCSTKRFDGASIMLNFKLLFLPNQCLDYVIVHELAHTKIRNHSKAFWSLVKNIIPDYKNNIKTLKEKSYNIGLAQ
jgi:predicted metal-dependent hydrolase